MSLNVLKLGGGAGVEHTAVLQNLATCVQSGERWVLVHGASDATNRFAEEMGLPIRTITSAGGHISRYTDARMIDVYTAAAASVNQRLVAELSQYGVPAVGLAGPNLISARRRPIRAIQNGRSIVIRDDYSGRITAINAALLNTLLDAGFLPVVAPVALGEEGERLNVDGDLVSAQISRTLAAENLLILSNVAGLLRDIDDPISLITQFEQSEIETYEAFALGRMKKKLLAAREVNTGRVILADSRLKNPIDTALNGAGTHILCQQGVLDAQYSR